MNKEPQTWRDILKKRMTGPQEDDSSGHSWTPIGQKGGKSTPIRTYSKGSGSFRRSATVTGFHKTPKVVFYQCKNCKIKGKKTIGEDPSVVLDERKYDTLTCDEVIVKDIIE